MFPALQRLRLVIAVLCGIAYLATLQQGSLLALTVFLHGTHEMQIVNETGEIELVFHHHDDDDDKPAQSGIHLNDHHHHGDHVIKLASSDNSLAAADTTLRVQSAACLVPCVTASLIVVPRFEFTPTMRARPPPLINGGVLYCLRTTVLVV